MFNPYDAHVEDLMDSDKAKTNKKWTSTSDYRENFDAVFSKKTRTATVSNWIIPPLEKAHLDKVFQEENTIPESIEKRLMNEDSTR